MGSVVYPLCIVGGVDVSESDASVHVSSKSFKSRNNSSKKQVIILKENLLAFLLISKSFVCIYFEFREKLQGN